MIASVSARGSKIARCAVSAASAARLQPQANAPTQLHIWTGIGRHPALGVPGGSLKLVRRRQ